MHAWKPARKQKYQRSYDFRFCRLLFLASLLVVFAFFSWRRAAGGWRLPVGGDSQVVSLKRDDHAGAGTFTFTL
jgi:hypothetical protein